MYYEVTEIPLHLKFMSARWYREYDNFQGIQIDKL